MRFRTYISAILILFVLQSCSLLKIESAQEPLTTSQLNSRLLTQSFIADASERVEWAADSIIYEEADFEIQKNEKKAFSGMITARSDFGNVTFKVKSKSTQLTTLSIRVGVFGDREASDLIYAKIKPKL